MHASQHKSQVQNIKLDKNLRHDPKLFMNLGQSHASDVLIEKKIIIWVFLNFVKPTNVWMVQPLDDLFFFIEHLVSIILLHWIWAFSMLWANCNEAFLGEDVAFIFVFVICFNNELHIEMLFDSKDCRDTIFTV